MPNWNAVLDEINNRQQAGAGALDSVRRDYLKKLAEKTGRNVIAYYSGWLQRGNVQGIEITDGDKNGFMNAIHGLDRNRGLDLLLHTPGGEIAATESIVDYLVRMFDGNVRAIIPQLAMSSGTMIACSCSSIVMGKQSSVGPIDPQFGLISAKGVAEEFKRAVSEVSEDPRRAPMWAAIIGKYHPTFIAQCENACSWAASLVTNWLASNMFRDHEKPAERAANTVQKLSEYGTSTNHAKHLSIDEARETGLKIDALEDDNELQDLVLTVHHAYMQTFSGALNVVKIIENQEGSALLNLSTH